MQSRPTTTRNHVDPLVYWLHAERPFLAPTTGLLCIIYIMGLLLKRVVKSKCGEESIVIQEGALRSLYGPGKMSATQIAEALGVNQSTVCRYMRKYCIEARARSEAVAFALRRTQRRPCRGSILDFGPGIRRILRACVPIRVHTYILQTGETKRIGKILIETAGVLDLLRG